jgi:hypothetical protein
MTTTDTFCNLRWIGAAAVAVLLGGTACGGAGSVSQSSPAVSAQPAPAGDLRAAGLSDPSFLTPLGIEGKYADHSVTLVGAYADPARLVMILRVSPNDVQPGLVSVTDDQGGQNASGGGGPTGAGDFFWHMDAGPRPRPDGVAHLTARVQWELPTGNPASPVAPLVLKFNLPVHKAVSLPAGSPFHLGSWTVTIQTLQVTPATVHVAALFEGASSDDLFGPNHLDLMTVLDETGKPLGPVSGGGGIAAGGNLAEFQWMRPISAGTYQLRFHGNGATHTVDLTVPASASI